MDAPTGRTTLAAVIGDPVRHSLSPVLLNAAFAAAGLDWIYVALEVGEGHVAEALAGVRALGIAGLSVTMPHKAEVAAACDELSDDAAALGAVNCVVPAGDQLIGHNTDGAGFVAGLAAEAGFDPRRRRCLVFGAGGAGRAVALALARAGAAEVAVSNRSLARAEQSVALLGDVGRLLGPGDAPSALADADLFVNATSLGMGVDEGLPFDPGLLHPGLVVADIVYQPLVTPLVAAARARGLVAVNGPSMLAHQAAVAFRLWTGQPAPIDAMTAALAAHLGSSPISIGEK